MMAPACSSQRQFNAVAFKQEVVHQPGSPNFTRVNRLDQVRELDRIG